MDITFENSGEKSNNAIIWNVCVDNIVIAKLTREYSGVSIYSYYDKGAYMWICSIEEDADLEISAHHASTLKKKVKKLFERIDTEHKLLATVIKQKIQIITLKKELEEHKKELER